MKYHLLFPRQTVHGVYIDRVPCSYKEMAIKLGDDLIAKKIAEHYLIIEGTLIIDSDKTYAEKEKENQTENQG